MSIMTDDVAFWRVQKLDLAKPEDRMVISDRLIDEGRSDTAVLVRRHDNLARHWLEQAPAFAGGRRTG